MNKILSKLLVALLVLIGNTSFAQTYVCAQSGANNVFPFGSTIADRVQYLYMPADFVPTVPMGTITKIYFKAASSGTSSFTNLNIKIGTTLLTAMPTGSNPWITGLTSCYFASSASITHVSGSWFSFTLSTPFFWDGTSNLIFDIYRDNAYSGGITLQQGGSNGNRRMWGLIANTTSNGGGTGCAEFALDIIPGSPCTRTTPLAATSISSMAAQVNWSAVPGSYQYEYIIDTTSPGKPITSPAITTATSAVVTGLYPGKTHYLRVRNYCSAVSYSLWDTIAFTTLPPCNKPTGFIASNIDSNSATIQWTPETNVITYQYRVDTFRAAPLSGSPGILTTPVTSVVKALTGLKEGRWQYVHIRAKCTANDSSAWSLDSFYTPTPCRKPVLSLTHLTANNAIVSWATVPTAYRYEYFFGAIADLPANGTPVTVPAIQTPYLQPKTNYSAHVRCMCIDNGVKSNSGWESIDFTSTWAAGVNNVAGAAMQVEAYPNPVKDVLKIKATGTFSNAQLVITDIKGRVMNTLTLQDAETSVNVSGYASGIYILQYIDNEQTKNIRFTKE